MKKISHIGIAVNDLQKSCELFSKLLNKDFHTEFVSSESVTTAFFKMGESKIELISSDQDDSAITKYLKKHKEGMHHLAIDVDNIQNEIHRLKKEGFRFLNETPKIGADNKLIVFLHPKDTNGVLVEICQSR
ncbi:MAG: methylmalonyl-CoA epimerase [Flavobacteriales bacterium]|nr:methylmalonyl-CoA epimerase [Flavobacteriales bacterium]|tara:strand:- start:2391 stop:2786 length:396 start_codon:yes stop_codon:yes gene_type:complete